MSVLRKALTLLVGTTDDLTYLKMPKSNGRPLKSLTERELIQMESEIGRELFGPVPKGHRREFFNLDPTTWIWYEEYIGSDGKQHSTTTRYEVQENGVLKAQEGARYSYIEGEELKNLLLATRMYHERVMRGIYGRDVTSGPYAS